MNAPLKSLSKLQTPDQIILFGSRARGDAKPDSDHDICVIKSGISQRRKLTHQIYQSLFGVGVPVEIIVETPDRFNALEG